MRPIAPGGVGGVCVCGREVTQVVPAILKNKVCLLDFPSFSVFPLRWILPPDLVRSGHADPSLFVRLILVIPSSFFLRPSCLLLGFCFECSQFAGRSSLSLLPPYHKWPA
jgi:hypothetical protein